MKIKKGENQEEDFTTEAEREAFQTVVDQKLLTFREEFEGRLRYRHKPGELVDHNRNFVSNFAAPNMLSHKFKQMVHNELKRQAARAKHSRIQELKVMSNYNNLIRQDIYKSNKLEMIAKCIKILKERTRLRRISGLMKINEMRNCLDWEFKNKRHKMELKISGIFLASKFKRRFDVLKMKLGTDFNHRHRQMIRRTLTFMHQFKETKFEVQSKKLIASYLYAVDSRTRFLFATRETTERIVRIQRCWQGVIMFRLIRLKIEMNQKY